MGGEEQRGLLRFLLEEDLKLPGPPAQHDSLVYISHTDHNTTSPGARISQGPMWVNVARPLLSLKMAF